MATQTIEFAAPTGETITARLYAAGSDTIAATASTVTEQTNRRGVYNAVVSSSLSGVYRLVATDASSVPLATWWVTLANANGTYIAYEIAPETVAGSVWNSLLASYTTADTFGARIVRSTNSNNTVQITGGPAPHIAAVVHDAEPGSIPEDAFADGALSARVAAADFVAEVQNGLATSTALATVQADTDDLQSRLPAALVNGRMDSHTASIGNNTLTAAATAADFVNEIQSGLSTLTAAQVNAEVLDVLATDLFAELAAVPAASSSLKDKISFLFMLARNKVTQTASTQTLFADNTTTPVAASATSDVGGTFTRGEFA